MVSVLCVADFCFFFIWSFSLCLASSVPVIDGHGNAAVQARLQFQIAEISRLSKLLAISLEEATDVCNNLIFLHFFCYYLLLRKHNGSHLPVCQYHFRSKKILFLLPRIVLRNTLFAFATIVPFFLWYTLIKCTKLKSTHY